MNFSRTRPLHAVAVIAALFLAACSGGGDVAGQSAPPPAPIVQLVVAHNRGANGLFGTDSVSFVDTAAGLLKKVGINTYNGTLSVDASNNEILAIDDVASAIKVYSLGAVGNPQPLRAITGYSAGFVGYVAADPQNAQIAVMRVSSRFGGINIDFFDRLSNGNAAPARTLTTRLQFAQAFALDSANNEILIVNSSAPGNPIVPLTAAAINVYALGGVGLVSPLRTISGDLTGLSGLSGIAVDAASGEVFVADATNNAIYVYSRGASGNVAPLRSITGPATGLKSPSAITLDTVNHLVFVSNLASDSVTAYPTSGNGNISPAKTFSAPQHDLTQPTSIAIFAQ